MAEAPSLTRVPVDILSGDVPQWFQEILTPLNQFLSNTTNALQKGLTLGDNIQASVLPQTFTTTLDANNNYTITISNPLGRAPSLLTVSMLAVKGAAGANVQKTAWSHTATMNSQNKIAITFQGLQNAVTYTCNVVLL